MIKVQEQMMAQFSYKILPPAWLGGKNRAFLFEYVFFKQGTCGYAGQNIQKTIWMKEISDKI